MIEVQLLRYALAAADTGSFSRAADHFRVKQSTLSKSILYLEQLLGISIFTRSTRGVSTTRPGDMFLGRARAIVEEIEALGRDSSSYAKGHCGTLRIGLLSSQMAGELCTALRAFAGDYPDAEVEATEGTRDELQHALMSDRIDLAILPGELPGCDCRVASFWSEPLSIALPADSPLAALERIYWTDLRKCSFVVTAADPGRALAGLVRARLSAPDLEPVIVTQAVGAENLLPFVAGDRVAITVGHRQQQPMPASGVVHRVPHDAFGPTQLEQRLHWQVRNRNPALRNFLDLLAQRYGRMPGDS